jgi:predicted phage terminase large subunit-like protein
MTYGSGLVVPASGVVRVRSTRDAIDAVRYEESLLDFTGAFWREVEPKEFHSNWHIEAICDHLQAVADWQVDRLLINMPPRHMKSLAANVFFPAWVWAQDPNPDDEAHYTVQVRRNSWRGPGVKFMHLSYDSALSIRDSGKCRQLITSSKYQRLWGHRFQLRDDQNQKMRFDNLAGGHRMATSEGGVITGEGADIIVYDDPHNVHDIGGSSSLARTNTLRFWDEALPSRLNDQEHGAFVVIMQRLHEHDLSGHILAKEQGWTHLCLPAVYEAKHPFPMRTSVVRQSTGQTWADPRQEGEVLWPAKFPRKALQRIAKDEAMTSHVAAGQLQQCPAALEGGLFKRAWFEHPLDVGGGYYSFAEAKRLHLVRAWDLAWTTEETGNNPDWTVGVLMGRDPLSDIYYVLDVVRGRWSPAELERVVKSVAARDGTGCRIRIPQDPGAGTFVAAYMRDVLRQAGGYSVTIEREQTSKAQRAAPLAAQAENRFLVLIKGTWTDDFVNELCAFRPEAKDNVDDQVDAASAAFRALVRRPTFAAVGA